MPAATSTLSSDGYLWMKATEYFKSKYFLLKDAEWQSDFSFENLDNNITKNEVNMDIGVAGSSCNIVSSLSKVAGSSTYTASSVVPDSFTSSSNLGIKNFTIPKKSSKLDRFLICKSSI